MSDFLNGVLVSYAVFITILFLVAVGWIGWGWGHAKKLIHWKRNAESVELEVASTKDNKTQPGQ